MIEYWVSTDPLLLSPGQLQLMGFVQLLVCVWLARFMRRPEK